jgi:putative ABC transport system permease protein
VVVAEVSLSMVILVGAGLMIKGFLRVLPSHPGFEVEHRLRMPVRLTRHPVYDDSLQGPGRRLQFVAEVKRRMERVDGVRAVGLTSFVPLVRESAISNVQLDGNAAGGESRLTAHHRTISPNYFDVMRMSITRGRAFSDNDAAGGPHVVIINETAARRWWPDHHPIGRQLGFTQGPARVRAEVIGVVNDVRFSGHSTRTQAEIYVPFSQSPPRVINFVVETSVDPRTLVTALRRTIWSVDPALPIDEAESLADVTREAVAIPRFYSTIMGAFAIIAIALAAAGIHSVLAFAVARRSREIGIRIALGAARRSVVMTVVRQGMALTAIGIVIGIAGAGALTRVLESVLFEVDPTDPAVFVLTTVVLLAVALLACVAPAVRAVNVDPLQALKSE